VTPVHVVMTGSDATALDPAAASDTRARLQRYAALLPVSGSGSELTYLAIGAPQDAATHVGKGLRIVPVPGGPATARAALLRHLHQEHRRRPIDVIATQTPDEEAWAALAFARGRGVQVVAQIHYDLFSPALTRDVDPLRRAVRSARRSLALRALRRCAAIRVVGPSVAAALASRPGMPPVHVVPVPAAMPPAVSASPRLDRVLFVGRLAPEKRLDLWLEVAGLVARERPHTRFDIVGDGPEAQRLAARVAGCWFGERVTLHGALPPAQVAGHYADASVLLLTSAHEGFGRVLVEAGRSGLVSVAVNIPGPRDIIIDGQTGILCSDSPNALAQAVLALLGDPDRAGRMGEAAQLHVERHFNPELLARQWMSLLVAVTEGRAQ
jgi:glycosyltransferase involved in cell wall biosynthesis